MEKARLDKILIDAGYVTRSQVKQALKRQETQGGRFGSHLVFFKYLTEQQLIDALSTQHNVPGFRVDEQPIDPHIIDTFPVETVIDLQALPIRTDAANDEAHVAMVAPDNQEAIKRIKKALKISRVKPYVISESMLRLLVAKLFFKNEEEEHLEEPPELTDKEVESSKTIDKRESKRETNVLLVSKSRSLKDSLEPIFEREGFKLHVLSNRKDIQKLAKKHPIDHVLTAKAESNGFSEWARQKQLFDDGTEQSQFESISGALLDNPIAYRRLMRSLFRSLQMTAELRCAASGWAPPYTLICNETHRLAKSVGFSRVAADGLQIASLLLIPGGDMEQRERPRMSFVDFSRSLECARSLLFPWNVHGALKAFVDLMSGKIAPDDPGKADPELSQAAQILALVWYRHLSLVQIKESHKTISVATKRALRNQAGRIASIETVEAYIRLLERKDRKRRSVPYTQIFVVSRANKVSKEFTSRLRDAGFYTVLIEDLAEAQAMCECFCPAGIVIHRESFPKEVLLTNRLLKLDSSVLLYAFTQKANASMTLDLFDAGFDDVFAPPFDFDLIAAKITKSLTGTSQKNQTKKTTGFGATFRAFSFMDLIQALGQSHKTAHIRLTRSTGQKADIFMRSGKMVYAVCDDLKGVDAIHHVIRWGEDGEFTVEPTSDIPPKNVSGSNEAILMEGCRLLDESRV